MAPSSSSGNNRTESTFRLQLRLPVHKKHGYQPGKITGEERLQHIATRAKDKRLASLASSAAAANNNFKLADLTLDESDEYDSGDDVIAELSNKARQYREQAQEPPATEEPLEAEEPPAVEKPVGPKVPPAPAQMPPHEGLAKKVWESKQKMPKIASDTEDELDHGYTDADSQVAGPETKPRRSRFGPDLTDDHTEAAKSETKPKTVRFESDAEDDHERSRASRQSRRGDRPDTYRPTYDTNNKSKRGKAYGRGKAPKHKFNQRKSRFGPDLTDGHDRAEAPKDDRTEAAEPEAKPKRSRFGPDLTDDHDHSKAPKGEVKQRASRFGPDLTDNYDGTEAAKPEARPKRSRFGPDLTDNHVCTEAAGYTEAPKREIKQANSRKPRFGSDPNNTNNNTKADDRDKAPKADVESESLAQAIAKNSHLYPPQTADHLAIMMTPAQAIAALARSASASNISYDLPTGEYLSYPVTRSYHLGAMGRYGPPPTDVPMPHRPASASESRDSTSSLSCSKSNENENKDDEEEEEDDYEDEEDEEDDDDDDEDDDDNYAYWDDDGSMP
ncbi:hypothetical protein ACJQWK_10275 [Exserohilum turcicum]